MRRVGRPPLRGSVQQQSAPVRLRAREVTRFGFLMRLGALVGSIVLILGIATWLWSIGWPQKLVTRLYDGAIHLTQQAHFSVKDIIVEGRQQTSKEALSAAVGITAGAPILSFNAADAQSRLAKLPWVASAIVERRLPDTVVVHLMERMPLARWQHEGRTVVIDGDGTELLEAKPEQFTHLPLVVGEGAPLETARLLDELKAFPDVATNMVAAVRVSDRRWDIHLQPNVIARLPEVGVLAALKTLEQLISEKKILERDVVGIDLRLPDRLVIEPGNTPAKPPAGDTRL